MAVVSGPASVKTVNPVAEPGTIRTNAASVTDASQFTAILPSLLDPRSTPFGSAHAGGRSAEVRNQVDVSRESEWRACGGSGISTLPIRVNYELETKSYRQLKATIMPGS
jgi:hypothetical protein